MNVYFGKYKGFPLSRLPNNYLRWVAHCTATIHPELVEEARELLAQRREARAAPPAGRQPVRTDADDLL